MADALFTRSHISSLQEILSRSARSANAQCDITLVASLVSQLCTEERHRVALASGAILDALAQHIAGIVMSGGFVLPGAIQTAQEAGLLGSLPVPATSNADLAIILGAVACIISNSKFRASQLLFSPAMLAVFPLPGAQVDLDSSIPRPSNQSSDLSSFSFMDCLLPDIPAYEPQTVRFSAFPPLGLGVKHTPARSGRSNNHGSSQTWGISGLETEYPSENAAAWSVKEGESPLIAWLLYIIRTGTGLERIAAASVLAVLYRADLADKSRERAIGLLVIPLLTRHLEDDSTRWDQDLELRHIRESVPAILALFITDNEQLQAIAYDGKLIKKLSKMLKVAYDPAPETLQYLWSPDPVDQSGEHLGVLSKDKSLSPLLLHKIKVRESTLKAFAALVPAKDEYRKAVIDHGVVPYIVESMKPNPSKPLTKVADPTDTILPTEESHSVISKYGSNPVPVLIAACHAIRALSRSVSILRTTLIDHGVAMPLFNLLQHSDVSVQIAATAAVCNIVLDFSPMREVCLIPSPKLGRVSKTQQTISEAGILKILCEHAHSTNAELRINALWALKHLVLAAGNNVKRTCLEELGQGWLVQLICDDTEDEALQSKGQSNLYSASDLDVEMIDEADIARAQGLDTEMNGSSGSSLPSSDSHQAATASKSASGQSRPVQIANARLEALRDEETNPSTKARKSDVAVQEQGLGFIRNLICGTGQPTGPGTPEMIDYLFGTLGQERVFEILASKLRPKVIRERNASGGQETRIIPPQAEIIVSAGYILVHMAASVPRHRQLVISQTALLKLILPLYSHPSKEVRVALCWLAINLTYKDNDNDGYAHRQRASELRKLGFESKLQNLENDPELDVRERAKTAAWQIGTD